MKPRIVKVPAELAPELAERMPQMLVFEYPERYSRTTLERLQDGLLEHAMQETREQGQWHATLHAFLDHQGHFAQLIMPVNEFFRDDESKQLLRAYVQSRPGLYATMFLVEMWIAARDVGAELLRRQAAGERVKPSDMPGREEGLLSMLETSADCRGLCAPIQRDAAGQIAGFGPVEVIPTIGGRMFGFVSRSAS